MTDTLSVLQGSILALSTLCIGMSKTGAQGLMLLSSYHTWQWLSVRKNLQALSFLCSAWPTCQLMGWTLALALVVMIWIYTKSAHVTSDWYRCLLGNPLSKTISRKSFQKIYPDCHHSFCDNDALMKKDITRKYNFK